MCAGCWDQYGTPKVWNDKVKIAVETINALYEMCAAGGNMHIITDDWNIEDENFPFCLNAIQEASPTNEYSEEQKVLEMNCYNAMIACTVAERASALAIVGEHWTPE